MNDLTSTFAIDGHPLHPLLVPIPIGLFVSALATDIAYAAGCGDGFAAASLWLLGGGLAGAVLAAIAGLTDFAANSAIRALRDAWLHLFANLTVVVIELVSFCLRLGDRWIAGGLGLGLSVVAVLLLLFSGWKGGELVFRYGVGQVRPREP